MLSAIEQLAVEIGQLLAASPLDKKIKEDILENLDTMPEDLVFKLRDALKNEKDEVDAVVFDIELFLKKQDEKWAQLEENQKKAAEDVTNQLFETLKDN